MQTKTNESLLKTQTNYPVSVETNEELYKVSYRTASGKLITRFIRDNIRIAQNNLPVISDILSGVSFLNEDEIGSVLAINKVEGLRCQDVKDTLYNLESLISLVNSGVDSANFDEDGISSIMGSIEVMQSILDKLHSNLQDTLEAI